MFFVNTLIPLVGWNKYPVSPFPTNLAQKGRPQIFLEKNKIFFLPTYPPKKFLFERGNRVFILFGLFVSFEEKNTTISNIFLNI